MNGQQGGVYTYSPHQSSELYSASVQGSPAGNHSREGICFSNTQTGLIYNRQPLKERPSPALTPSDTFHIPMEVKVLIKPFHNSFLQLPLGMVRGEVFLTQV